MKLFATLACAALSLTMAAALAAQTTDTITVDVSGRTLTFKHSKRGDHGNQTVHTGETVQWVCGQTLPSSGCIMAVAFETANGPCDAAPGQSSGSTQCEIAVGGGTTDYFGTYHYGIAVYANGNLYVGDPVVIVDNGVTIERNRTSRKPPNRKP